jgi:prepilin-type N-terminal cleavage/methylation domain-containing protein/prepilin-type processing-associated H-X9-DG protein
MSNHHKRTASRAFTLIELLVTLAIIAILASLLLLAIGNAKANAHKTQCASNLRQLAVALQTYVNESRDYPLFYSFPWRDGGKMWYDDLEPYTKQSWTNSLYLCPSYTGPPTKPGNVSNGGFQAPTGSYGYNIGGVGANWSELKLGLGGGVAKDLSRITEIRDPFVRVPSDMVAFGDAYVEYDSGNLAGDHGVIGINFRGGMAALASPPEKRHRGKLIVAFCDGHTSAIRAQNLLFDHSDDVLRRWNNDHEPHRELLPP